MSVRTHAEPSLAIGIDIGGTKIAAAVVDDRGVPLANLTRKTPSGADEATMETIFELIERLRAEHPTVIAIGIGAAGLIEWPSGYIRWAPHNSYRDLPLRQLVYQATGLPTVVETDANAAVVAETRFGAAVGASTVILLTVGTGIGGGLLLRGRLHRGVSGIAGEIGHIVVDPAGPDCACGNAGCLEAVASGTALTQAARDAALADPDSRLLDLAGTVGAITGETVAMAAREGDPLSQGLFDRLGHWLGVGIASVVTLLDPEVVVIGGGVAAAGELLLAPTTQSFNRHLFAPEHRTPPRISLAKLGADSGVIGAATVALAGPEADLGMPDTPS